MSGLIISRVISSLYFLYFAISSLIYWRLDNKFPSGIKVVIFIGSGICCNNFMLTSDSVFRLFFVQSDSKLYWLDNQASKPITTENKVMNTIFWMRNWLFLDLQYMCSYVIRQSTLYCQIFWFSEVLKSPYYNCIYDIIALFLNP